MGREAGAGRPEPDDEEDASPGVRVLLCMYHVMC